MKRRTLYVAAAIAGALFGIGMGTANASPSGEYAARTANHLPSTIHYLGGYDRTTPYTMCYMGRAGHRTHVRGIPVKAHHSVEYCTDGWVTIHVGGDYWRDVPPHLCAYEDSTNCFWDAGSEGNGDGHSFYATTHCVRYVERAFAKDNDFCESAS